MCVCAFYITASIYFLLPFQVFWRTVPLVGMAHPK